MLCKNASDDALSGCTFGCVESDKILTRLAAAAIEIAITPKRFIEYDKAFVAWRFERTGRIVCLPVASVSTERLAWYEYI
jgi:hypothetical protein